MTRTRKVLIAVLSMVFVICMTLCVVTGCAPAQTAALASIKITTPPTAVSYVSGSNFDPAGMVVTARYADKTEKELASTDWTYEDPGALTVAAGKFEATKSIKISYTEGEVTKTANQSVKIHNYITAATITTYPQQEYFIGQGFNVAGMVINATLEDGSQASVEVTAENSTYAPAGVLSSATEEVTVTVGNFDIEVPVSVLNAIYVEAETGYRDGQLIEQSTGDSGNIRVDATTDKAKTGAENLYKAQLKANFALEQIKLADDYDEVALSQPSDEITVTVGGKAVTKQYEAIVAWLNDEANQEAIDAYLASDEYTQAVEEYLASEQFVIDYSKFVAHESSPGAGEHYLGQNGQGDVLSFVFESSEAATGSIAFRLSSAYLYRDNNGGWLSVIMGDVQFNKLVEFYVNGVKATIDDSVLLEGGMTADGSADNVLWCNWKEVQFNNVDFVAGRNVIELRFLNHGIVAANNYNFAANVDTLLVAPSEGSSAQLDTFDNNNVNIEYTLSNVSLADGALNVAGTLSGASQGYYGDLLDVKVGNHYADLELDGDSFSAVLDLSVLSASENPYNITVGGSAISSATEGTEEVGYLTCVLGADGRLTVSSSASLVFEPKGADIGEENGKPYFYITGVYTSVNYTDDEVKAQIANSYFDLQNDDSHSKAVGNGWKSNKFTSTAADVTLGTDVVDGETVYTYKVKFDVSSLTASAYVSHYNPGGSSATDFKPGIDVEKEITIGSKKYTLVIVAEDVGDNAELFWNCPGLIIEDSAAPVNNLNTAMTLFAEGEKVYIQVSGTYANMEEAEVKAAYAFDVEVGAGANTGDIHTFSEADGNLTWTFADGTFTVKIDVTDLDAEGPFWFHYKAGSDLTCTANADSAITIGNKTYVLRNHVFSWGNRDLFCIDPAE
ncbi:MAG: hypothetical protein E7370_03595 [Clostridiales bacterium]|nr:hypothetical protein [Clostridiales bacterium]